MILKDGKGDEINMLRDEIAKYTELTGKDGYHEPIIKIGAFLDGYEKGLSVLDKIRAEIVRKADSGQWSEATIYGMKKSIAIIDKYKEESEDEE